MKSLKHIGKIKNTGARVAVIFRTLPGESNFCLVLPVNNLPDSYHDSIMKLIEEPQAQDAFEFGEILFSRVFSDGRPMLRALQADGRMQKVATDMVVMNPTPNDAIPLDQLNVLIAEQKNCAIDDLCNFVSGAKNASTKSIIKEAVKESAVVSPATLAAPSTEALTDKDIARSYRSQADSMYKEAARLRKEADELDPPQKKATKVKESADA
jgi:hypothetical protein